MCWLLSQLWVLLCAAAQVEDLLMAAARICSGMPVDSGVFVLPADLLYSTPHEGCLVCTFSSMPGWFLKLSSAGMVGTSFNGCCVVVLLLRAIDLAVLWNLDWPLKVPSSKAGTTFMWPRLHACAMQLHNLPQATSGLGAWQESQKPQGIIRSNPHRSLANFSRKNP